MSALDDILVALGLKTKSTTAASAKERLQVVVSHQRRHRDSPDYLPMLEKDILAVIAKYVEIGEDKVDIKFDKGGNTSTLEVNIELPSHAIMRAKVRKVHDEEGDIIASPRKADEAKSDAKKKAELFDA